VIDETLNSQVLELLSTNLPSTFITTPSLATRTLGIKLPILVFLVKNLGKYWSFEITTLDDRGEKRRFRASNFQVGNNYKEERACTNAWIIARVAEFKACHVEGLYLGHDPQNWHHDRPPAGLSQPRLILAYSRY
jgi:hypothetical protein